MTSMTTMNDMIANEVIRERITHRTAVQRPDHHRTVKALRGIANRLDRRS